MRTLSIRLGAAAALSLLLTTAGGAQARPAALPTAARTAQAPLPDDAFALDDALLAGIPITEWQARRIVSLRRVQLAGSAAARPQLRDAVLAVRRAHERGDDETAHAIMAMLEAGAAQAQTLRLAALRALLAPDQLPRFDANADSLSRRDGR